MKRSCSCYSMIHLQLQVPRKSFLESFLQELRDNLEELLRWYYIDSDVFIRLKPTTIQWCVIRTDSNKPAKENHCIFPVFRGNLEEMRLRF